VVVYGTGNLVLREDFAHLANGAYIASVTSADDELELTGLDVLYERSPAGDHITRYATTGHYFYVLNEGNAVNFLHGASLARSSTWSRPRSPPRPRPSPAAIPNPDCTNAMMTPAGSLRPLGETGHRCASVAPPTTCLRMYR
jgi:hypothetical protein